MTVTLAQLESDCLNILREEDFSTAYPQSLMDLLINQAQSDILGGRVINPLTKEEARKGDLHFMNAEVFYTNVGMVYTTADLTSGDTIIYADTTNYPATGNLYIGGEIVAYTGTTATSFTGVTGLTYGFPEGTAISIAFALPTDFSSTINVIYQNRIKLPAKSFDDMYEDLNSFKGNNIQRIKMTGVLESPYKIKPFYTIKDAAYLILFQLNSPGDIIRLRYEKLPPTMVTTPVPVNCSIDDDTRARICIPHLAVGTLLFHRGEEQRAGEVLSFAISQIKQLYTWYNDTVYESQNGVQYRMGKNKVNI